MSVKPKTPKAVHLLQSTEVRPAHALARLAIWMLPYQARTLDRIACPQLLTAWREAARSAQVRTFDLVQKDKIFAIGYCFGGGGVLELMRAWPSTPGLLGEPHCKSLPFHGQIVFLAHMCTRPRTPGLLKWPHRFSLLISGKIGCLQPPTCVGMAP